MLKVLRNVPKLLKAPGSCPNVASQPLSTSIPKFQSIRLERRTNNEFLRRYALHKISPLGWSLLVSWKILLFQTNNINNKWFSDSADFNAWISDLANTAQKMEGIFDCQTAHADQTKANWIACRVRFTFFLIDTLSRLRVKIINSTFFEKSKRDRINGIPANQSTRQIFAW